MTDKPAESAVERYEKREYPEPRSRGGHKGPILDLCGHGTSGCHGEAEHLRLHFRYGPAGWQYLRTERPTKYAETLLLDGWHYLE